MNGRSARLPVVMFHTIREKDPNWLWDELTCPVDLFERMVKALRSRGYGPATLEDLADLQQKSESPRDRRLVLTFDDGYLDNWVYVYPILKRVGLRGIVYVNPEFVDPGEAPRPTLEDVWAGRVAAADLQSKGFLNWAEIEQLDRDGVLEIGSHSMSHTWYPIGPEIVDFHRPGLQTPWLAWNAQPQRKPYYRLEDQSVTVPWGTPIHRNGRSLGIRRYFPDEDVSPAVTRHVAEIGGERFFSGADWAARLLAVAAEADRGRGRFETDEEQQARFTYEIAEAFRILEARLGHPVRHFCWPGGAYCDEAWDVLDRVGCRTTTIRRNDRRRWQLDDPRYVRRISEFRRYSFVGRSWPNEDASMLATACDVELGRRVAPIELRARKAVGALRAGFHRI